MDKPIVKSSNAHFLKGHASWLYCDNCNKTVAYLCYVTYRYFHFSFTCSCGSKGWVENQFGEEEQVTLTDGSLKRNSANKRYCCEKDNNPLFSPVMKNLHSYQAEVICKECKTHYNIEEKK